MTPVRMLVLAVATVVTWAAWLSWETGYRTTADGVTSGPYSWWQVAGCVLTLAVVTAVAGRFLPVLLVVPVVAVSFAAAWSVRAATADESGLWPVGAFLVLLGTAAGAAVVAGLVKLIGGRGSAS